MEPCGPVSPRRCPTLRQVARALILCAAFAASIGIILPDAWATPAATTTTLTISSAGAGVTSVASGAVVTLTATVVAGSAPVNPGQVKFCDASAAHCEDSALLATLQLTTAGTATYKFRPGIGSHKYQAVFVGTAAHAKSTSAVADLVVTGPYPTGISMVSSGQIGDYTLTAAVTGPATPTRYPTGNVSFLDTSNGNTSLGTAVLGAPPPWQDFTVRSTIPVGCCPQSVGVGDFNGDGIPDLVVSSGMVLLGNGDGTFTLKSVANFGEEAGVITVGDFNRDGILDLAVVNNIGAGTVTVLLGNGDGTFTTKSVVTMTGNSASIVAADFNGDGVLDLAVGGSDVTILLGNGDGTFTTKSTLDVGAGPQAIGDFNGDGITDIAIDGAVLLGNGDGTFTVKSVPTSGLIVTGDFNGDGITDIAMNNGTVVLFNEDGNFTVKSDGAGVWGLQVIDGIEVEAGNRLAVGDFNGDGIPDLVETTWIFNAPESSFTVLQGNGDGTFSTGATTTIGAVPWGIAVGDFNGDGLLDVAVILNLDGTVTAALNQVAVTTAQLQNVSVSGDVVHGVVARYSGDTNYQSSASSLTDLLAAPVSTTLSLSSSSNPSIGGAGIVLTATLSPFVEGNLATNGETVTFYNGGSAIGTGSLFLGVATLNISSLLVGTDMFSAKYPGDANFVAANSNSITQSVISALPVFSPPGGTYISPQMVTITDPMPGATIYYTTDGPLPGRSSPIFNPMNPIMVSSSQTIKALAVAPGYVTSPEGVAAYTIAALAPVISPPTDFYSPPISVTITDGTPNTVIHYTTDGTTPTATSPVYGGTFTVTSPERVRAIATAPNLAPSAVTSADFDVMSAAAEPIISLPSGTYSGPQMVMITDTIPGAVIYYTTNGMTPSRSSAVYSSGSPIMVTSSQTIKALAVAPSYSTSPEAVGVYNITP